MRKKTGKSWGDSLRPRWPNRIWILGLGYALLTALLSSPDLLHDARDYFNYGRSLIYFGVYSANPGTPDMIREPGYGFFLAPAFFILKWVGLVFKGGESVITPQFEARCLVIWQSLFSFFGFYLLAFHTQLPKRFSRIFFMIAIFSPTLWGTSMAIYSETLAITLLVFFLFFFLNCLRGSNWAYAAGAAFSWALLIQTKSYFLYSVVLFLLAGFYFLYLHRYRVGNILIGVAFISIATQAAWGVRNRIVLGPENVASSRMINAMAGKVFRWQQIELPRQLPRAVLASVGANLCIQVYGKQECMAFHAPGADGIGFPYWAECIRRFGSPAAAEANCKKEIVLRFFDKPGHQLVGILMEAIRISFFESPGPMHTRIALLDIFPRIWHFVGSLLGWILIVFGFRETRRNSSFVRKTGTGRLMAFICAVLIAYHYVIMSQVTNVVRYVFPILPALYFFVSLGILSLWESKFGRQSSTSKS